MEKQDLDNLQQTTKEYSGLAQWLSVVIFGAIFVVFGFMEYFRIVWWVTFLILLGLIVSWGFGSKHLTRNIMCKGLGYVGEKKEITPWREQALIIIILIPLLIIKDWRNWDNGIWYTVMFFGFGFIGMIIGLMNRKRIGAFYGGIYFIICALMWIYPMKNVFNAHKMAPRGIACISIGLIGVIFGIISYFQYKKLIQKVKGTN